MGDKAACQAGVRRAGKLIFWDRDASTLAGTSIDGKGAPVIASDVIERVLNTALRKGVEFAEVFVEDRRGSSARFDDGKVEELNTGRDRGAGVRVVVGDTTGFAHTSDLTESALLAAAEAAAAAARGSTPSQRSVNLSPGHMAVNDVEVLPQDVPKSAKVELLQRANDAARSQGDALRQVSVAYGDSRRQFLVANSDGVFASDDQIRTRFVIQCVAMGDGGMQTAFDSVGQTAGFELFSEFDVEEMARRIALTALVKLRAQPAPTGEMPIVLEHGAGGVLFHEACGHGLEADHILKDVSVFRGQVGRQVASSLVTLVDDGTAGPQWGAARVDDEGHPVQRNVLIKDGILTDYMWDYLRSRKEGHAQSGNGRRQSYQHLPMVRMTNTFLENGEADAGEIVSQTQRGIYVAQLGGGQVNTASGDFVFGMTEAYLIENGHITEPLRDANLIGNGPQVLKNIDVIANDFAYGWPGTCGKDGQSVPVGQGQPTLRVPVGLSVGGTAA